MKCSSCEYVTPAGIPTYTYRDMIKVQEIRARLEHREGRPGHWGGGKQEKLPRQSGPAVGLRV